MKKLREYAELYLKKAGVDEVLLATVIDSEEISDEIFGFHAQQAIEKILKAVLTTLDVRIAKTHDLRRLMDYCAEALHPLPDNLAK